MRSTYYLSAYLPAVGAAAFYWQRHDQNVALWRREGERIELVRYWELERVSGLKHHVWPFFTAEHRDRLLSELLRPEGLTLQDIVTVWGLSDTGDSNAIVKLAKHHGVSVHSLGHLFSGVLLDSRIYREETVIGLAIDGGPDFVLEDRLPPYWYSGAVVRDGEMHIRPVESPGLLYTAAVMAFGQEPGTLMASTSVCCCDASIPALDPDAIASLTFYGAVDRGWATATQLMQRALEQGQSLMADGAFAECGETRLADHEHVRTAIMRQVQQRAEEIAVRNVRRLAQEFDVETDQAYLAMSGGSALNCPTNTRLMSEFGFRELLCPPCANDGGQALGLGLAGFYTNGVLPGAEFIFPGPYVGPSETALEGACAEYDDWISGVSPFEADQFTADIEAGPVAWIDGASEIGPRALGHRSLLADPRTLESKDELNRVKRRQWWRPVAPLVLESRVGEWFVQGRRSPYMLEVFNVREEVRHLIPAVVHLDGTARLQSLAASDDARLHAALSAFADRTGVPILCNTSLNAKGEPIIQTAAQAMELCLSEGVQVLYVDGTRVELLPAPDRTPKAVPAPRRAELFAGQEVARDSLWAELAEQDIGVEVMALVARSPQLARMLSSDRARAKVRAVAERTAAADPAWLTYVDHLRAMYGPGGTFEAAFGSSGATEEALMPVVARVIQNPDGGPPGSAEV